jgi:predicted DNA-binding transcriptional regulator YafY
MYAYDPLQKPAENNPLFQGIRPQRLLKLAALLENGETWSAQHLAERFRVCRRTIFRDVQLLRNANVPIVFDADQGGYRITSEPQGNSSSLHPDELVALVLAIKFVGRLPESISRPCDRALAKILSMALPRVRTEAIRILDEYEPDEEEAIPPEFFEHRQSG